MLLNNIIIKILIRLIALSALCMTILPSILHFMGKLASDQVDLFMAFGMVLWFLTGYFWLGRKTKDR